jgi:hypothetical protein
MLAARVSMIRFSVVAGSAGTRNLEIPGSTLRIAPE